MVWRCTARVHRGMLLVWAFNHAEATKCFQRASAAALIPQTTSPAGTAAMERGELRATAAMALWAAAHALCPNYNKPLMSKQELGEARGLNRRAAALLEQAREEGSVDVDTAAVTVTPAAEGGSSPTQQQQQQQKQQW